MSPYTTGNSVELKINGVQAFDIISNTLQSATHHIHVDMMLFLNDKIGSEIAQILMDKARDGIEVRVMFDYEITRDGGYIASAYSMKPSSHNRSVSDIETLTKNFRDAGVKVIDSYEVGDGRMDDIPEGIPQEFKDRQKLINDNVIVNYFHHDHRKIIIVDGQVGLIGSLHPGEEYLYHEDLNENIDRSEDSDGPDPDDKWEKWHDVIAKVEGPVVNDLQKLFVERWLLSSPHPRLIFKELTAAGPTYEEVPGYSDLISLSDPNYFPVQGQVGTSSVKVLSSGPGLPNEIRTETIDRINAATDHIYVENPYFYDDNIIDALEKARQQRQIDVKVIEPAINDCSFCQDAGQKRYEEMINAGIEVYEYQNHFSHTKVTTIDGQYTILGSYNYNWRSAYKDLEANIIVDDTAFTQVVENDLMLHDIDKSNRIETTDWWMRNRNPATIFLEAIDSI